MNGIGNQIIFKQLLDRHQRIQIPMIQRDFAQGRETEKEVREEFLNALHDALLLPQNHESLPLNLDFIYGSVEGDKETRFLPLDGQQRLTTLFLLHWYLAWKDGCQDEFKRIFCQKNLSRFSYSVRPSSMEFFNALVTFCPDSSPEDVPSLKDLIADQPWYFRYWRLDPTIQSSLTMLESIHVRFHCAEGFFNRLVDEEQPAITFQLLDLENFGLSDDLYIKMNARGKPLTAFETFKARYEQELENQFEGETRTIDGQNFPVSEYFARRMDTQWADFFWSHRDTKTNLFDDAVMNLFRTVALITRDPESDTYIKDISLLRIESMKSSYTVFHSKGWLDRRFSENLFMLLEAWSKKGAYFAYQLPDKHFFDETALFTKAVNNPGGLTYSEIVQFVGYIVFMRERACNVDLAAFQEWMRIIFNLSVNTTYERASDMQRSVAAIHKLATNSRNILNYFATTDKPTAGFNLQQVSEEKLKAELIQADGGWRPLFDQAEGHNYFRGQIEFLLEFCGAAKRWRDAGEIDWDTGEHLMQQKQFENYLKKSEIMFNTRGLVNLGECRWERALLSIGDYILPSGRNHSFLVNSSTDQASWKRLLRGTDINAREFLQHLLNRLTAESPLEKQLDEIIAGASELEPWRRAFVETPKAIEYCELRAIRRISDEEVYLLKKSQMNGAHAELFTFCLFHNSLEQMVQDGSLDPLKLCVYQSVNGADFLPHISLTYKLWTHQLAFNIVFSKGNFITNVRLDSLGEIPELQTLLCGSAGFVEIDNYLIRESSPTDIQNNLLELAQALTTTPSETTFHA